MEHWKVNWSSLTHLTDGQNQFIEGLIRSPKVEDKYMALLIRHYLVGRLPIITAGKKRLQFVAVKSARDIIPALTSAQYSALCVSFKWGFYIRSLLHSRSQGNRVIGYLKVVHPQLLTLASMTRQEAGQLKQMIERTFEMAHTNKWLLESYIVTGELTPDTVYNEAIKGFAIIEDNPLF